jgi:CubicO group peptidase (beta-lactamase class C family)
MSVLSRRDFLAVAGIATAGVALKSELANAQSALGNTDIEFGKGREENGVDSEKLNALNDLFEQQINDGIHPGAQLCVRVKDKTVFNRFGGFAITPSTRMKHDTKNLLFSATKPMGAAATMLLVEQGYLELDKPLVHYWPAFARGGAGKKDVTVRHVLGHQGGFPSGPNDFNYEQFNDPSEAMKAMERVELSFEPGSKFQYHPINYGWALGELIRRTSGVPVERFVKENLFDPLGCINASIGVPADELDEISYMYRVNDRSHTI